jgi:site-specific DNA-methyltransferase (adenine-specific)
MQEPQNILDEARKLAKSAKTWADLSNALFDPLEGLVARFFPNPKERSEFRKTTAYDELHALVEKKMEETGVANGANPRKSGKFVVRLPHSLHAALEKEAHAEGTSLNQLVVTKLAIQLDSLAGDKLSRIIQAFGEVRSGYSVDRVIADPELNRRFLHRCRELRVSGMDYELNWSLMSARKKGELSDLPKTKRYTEREIDEFEYASELAVRFLEDQRAASLDRIICDPELAAEFDKYAARLAPGFTPLQYRWAALGLRKAGRLSSDVKSVEPPDLESLGKATSIKIGAVPSSGGLYLFSSEKDRVFLGQTDNLRHRIERHMEVSKSQGLPDWLWDTHRSPLRISVASLPEMGRSTRQKIEVLLVKTWKPVLNLSRVA